MKTDISRPVLRWSVACLALAASQPASSQRLQLGFEFAPPEAKLGPHVAALGMRFYSGSQFPAEYRNNIFIAEHGSWNRSRKSGYRIVRVVLEGGRVIRHEVFAEGWLLADEKVWGRPVDIEFMADGSLLVSDDHAGAIYRISHPNR